MSGDATQEGAKDEKEIKAKVEERVQKQGPRPRDEMASFLADKHRGQRDEDLAENEREQAKARGDEGFEPEIPDTKNLKKEEEYKQPEDPETIRQRELENEPIPGVTDDSDASKDTTSKKAEEGQDGAQGSATESAKTDAEAGKDTASASSESDDGGQVEMVEINVYGNKSMVPKDEVDAEGGISAYQKNRAAEIKLQQAQELLETARKTSGQSEDSAQDQSGGDPAKPATGVTAEQLQATVTAMQEGTAEEGVAALQKLLDQIGGASPSQDQNELVAVVTDRIEHANAMTAFKGKYGDYMEDPNLVAIITRRDEELRKNGDKRSYHDRYMAIGEEITTWLEGHGAPGAKTRQTEPTPKTQERQARKDTLPAEPKAANARAGGAPGSGVNQPPPRKSPRQIIQETRAARGQA